jgi:L-cysteine S-thiosulfotransferase
LGKIYDSDASSAFSNMPRGGRMGILAEGQIRDLTALLFDP